MLRNQNELAKLPIPELEDTVKEYLNWVKPIVDQREYQQTERKALAFLHASGAGKRLQDKLKKYEVELNQEDGNQSWLKAFWDHSWLSPRCPVVANLNYCGILESKGFNEKLWPEQIAALVVEKMVELYREISTESMDPEMNRTQPLCMEQYLNTIKTVRIPAKDCDQYYWGSKQMENNHIVIVKNDIYIKVPVTDENGKAYTRHEIAKTIKNAIQATELRKGIPIGAFTSGERNEAAEFYTGLLNNRQNQENITILKEALFLICFDPSYRSEHEFLKACVISDGYNRYFDKCSQIIITEDGEVGFNNEHTGADGTTWFAMLEKVQRHIVEEAGSFQSFGAISNGLQNKPANAFEEMKWIVNQEQEKALEDFLSNHGRRNAEFYIEPINFTKFGKNEIKQRKISPDAFFHIALQLAQFRTYQSLKSTYEPVAVRMFRQGRTECTRPVSASVKKLVESFDQGIETDQLREMVYQAAGEHIDRIKRCQKGLGVERHLLGLQLMMDQEDSKVESIVEFFEDESYKRLKHDFISTSGLGYQSIRYFAFAPVVEDGFGVGYAVLPDNIYVSISCFQNKSADLNLFVSELRKSLIDVLQVLK